MFHTKTVDCKAVEVRWVVLMSSVGERLQTRLNEADSTTTILCVPIDDGEYSRK